MSGGICVTGAVGSDGLAAGAGTAAVVSGCLAAVVGGATAPGAGWLEVSGAGADFGWWAAGAGATGAGGIGAADGCAWAVETTAAAVTRMRASRCNRVSQGERCADPGVKIKLSVRMLFGYALCAATPAEGRAARHEAS